MLDRFKGCMLGAAIGDALGMPNESTSPNLQKMRYGYRRAYKRHPNAGLKPGQFTDDTQLMILAGTLLADGRFNEERYAEALKELYARGGFRFPDGSVSAACEHMIRDNPSSAGVKSTTAGCLALAIPFTLAYPDLSEAVERAVRACNVTHTHPAAHAAVATLTVLIYYTINGSGDAIRQAEKKASVEDDVLGGRIRNALMLEREGVDVETAVLKIGHDVSVFQTLPLAFFLISRYCRRQYRYHRAHLRGIRWSPREYGSAPCRSSRRARRSAEDRAARAAPQRGLSAETGTAVNCSAHSFKPDTILF
ncbi:MAG: ADP-ribosylglycohydrolase family protein [Methanoregula sp.]|nr:ADP-ribosylglycohydrolase family protein [Methanoregula sp.]